MHQTFYIDIDEEITSIIERLRKAKAKEIVVVVPKRALLIQSIVNLKLLKKEADNLDLAIMLVTQDKLGKMLIEKAGILVQQKMDESLEEDVIAENDEVRVGEVEIIDTAGIKENKSQKNRLDKIGTNSYFDESLDESVLPSVEEATEARGLQQEISAEPEKIINKELVSGIGDDMRKRYGNSKFDLTAPQSIDMIKLDRSSAPKEIQPEEFRQKEELSQNDFSNRSMTEDKKIESFFRTNNLVNPDNAAFENYHSKTPVKYGKKILFKIILILAVLSALGGAVFLLWPKATITLSLKNKSKAIESTVMGDTKLTNIDYDREAIPAKIITVTQEISKTFPASGGKSVSNQKAHGKVTIYNEFSSVSQPLVATTRFQTEDGKIFRLSKGVTVPGMTKSGDQIAPGVIEADVIADESGEEYNIPSARFTIPGFKDSGSEKYAKFYAKSTSSMAGGGGGTQSVKVITDADVTSAKNKILIDLNAAMKDKIKSSAESGEILLDDAVSSDEAVYTLSNSIGEAVDSFEIKVNMKANVMVFNEADIKSLLNKIIATSGGGKVSIDGSSITIEYGKSEPNFSSGTINIKVNANSNFAPDINMDKLKRDILGKGTDELEAYLRTYSDIGKVEVNYWPPFLTNQIPGQSSRVELKLDK